MSQFGQDTEVLRIFNKKRGGYFIELGAHDGVTLSNTLLLEREYGWNGLCIEPNPELFEKLEKSRKCNVSNGLAFSESGIVVDFSCGNLLGGISDHIDKYLDVKKNANRIQLTTTTLTEILDSCNAPEFIDYLSLDTEGTELDILKGIDFSKYSFGFMNIEHNFMEPRRTEIKKFLFERGYSFYSANSVDDNYINSKLRSSVPEPVFNYNRPLRWGLRRN